MAEEETLCEGEAGEFSKLDVVEGRGTYEDCGAGEGGDASGIDLDGKFDYGGRTNIECYSCYRGTGSVLAERRLMLFKGSSMEGVWRECQASESSNQELLHDSPHVPHVPFWAYYFILEDPLCPEEDRRLVLGCISHYWHKPLSDNRI